LEIFEAAGMPVRSNRTNAALPGAIFIVGAVPKFEPDEPALT
jgi:hypothetical protein